MRIRWTTRIATAAGLLTLVAGVAAGGGTARAAARPAAAPAAAPTTAVAMTAGYAVGGQLNGVAATSANNAWAVGATGSIGKPTTLLLHWNGKAWAPAAGVKPVAGSLTGIAAVSATSAWAVGYTGWPNPAKPEHTLLMHWNGRTWAESKASVPAGGNFNAVAARGAVAWAVGTDYRSPATLTLVARWTGRAWVKVASPTPTGNATQSAVAAASATSAWAVGYTGLLTPRTLILHWNGRTWS